MHFHLKRDMCYKTHDRAFTERLGLKTLSRNTYFRNLSLGWDFFVLAWKETLIQTSVASHNLCLPQEQTEIC